MSQAERSYIPYGITGAGNHGSTFGKHSMTLIGPVKSQLLGLIKSIPFPDKSLPFNIGDYGTADGSSTMNFIRDLIVTLREHHGSEVQFQITYEDQEINDFNSLFKRLMGIIPDPPSYLLEFGNVYPVASGIHFQKQCVPSSSMHFIMTVLAVNWVSSPMTYKDSLYVYPDSTEEEKEALRIQSSMDWESFLLLRSKELKHGGLLFVVCDGEYLDEKNMMHFSAETFICMLTEIWRSFRDSGNITSPEFSNTNFGFCMYNPEHMKSVFDYHTKVYQSGLRLLSAEVKIVKDIFYIAWKEKKERTGVDNRQEFARNYVAAHRVWSNSTFLAGLSKNRTRLEKEHIVDDLYDRVESCMAVMNPEKFKNDIVMSYFLIEKKGN